MRRPNVFALVLGACVGYLLLGASHAFAASGTVIGSVTVEQAGFGLAPGTWTLLMPDRTSVKMTSVTHTMELTEIGNHSLFVEPPSGMAAKILFYKGDALTRTVSIPQISFVVAEGDTLRIAIEFVLTKMGDVSVNSSLSGIPFRLEGPNKITVNDVTPYQLKSTPEGQYTVNYYPEGCVRPRPQALLLRKDGRLNFNFTIECATLVLPENTEEEEQEESGAEKSVKALVNGENVRFKDVPQGAWFAPYVFTAVKAGIISGYKDEHGEPRGLFGPENPVTIGELAKIAHEIAGIDENERSSRPENRGAIGAWFAPYIASAERLDWLLFQDTSIDLIRPATRGEVLATLFQALGIPLLWPHGDVFTDVSRRTPYAAAIETAAKEKIVTGSTNADGTVTGMFKPLDHINRAEVAKILSVLIDTYKSSK